MGVFLSLVGLRRTGLDGIEVFEGLKAGVSNEYCSNWNGVAETMAGIGCVSISWVV